MHSLMRHKDPSLLDFQVRFSLCGYKDYERAMYLLSEPELGLESPYLVAKDISSKAVL